MSDIKPDPLHPAPTGDVITDHLVEDGLLKEIAAVDEETVEALDAEDAAATENSGSTAQADLERLERDELQRRAPAEDDLPDRAFDRITPGV